MKVKTKIVSLFLVFIILLFIILWYIFKYKEGNQDTDTTSINSYLTEQISNNLTSNAVSPGITTIDRYADPMCSANEYIYCVDGYIECDDIFGANQNSLQGMAPYASGNTLAGCGTYVNKINLGDYTTDYDISTNRVRGVYFDLSQCDSVNYPGKPWKVGGDSILKFQDCFASEQDANNAWDTITNTLGGQRIEIYNVNDQVLIQANYLNTLTTQGLPQILAVLDADQHNKLFKIINGQKYYNGTITNADTALYTVTLGIPGSTIDIEGVSNQYLLKNSLYNKYSNDYYSDLGSGSHPRPTCKTGTFTSCLANPPFTIQNGQYVSTSDPMITVANATTIADTGAPITPFVSPLLGPSVDQPSSLLEYNYFKNQPSDSPFIQCIADYGTNIGDNLCCGQDGILQDTKHICPSEVPTCQGYSKDDNQYGYCG